MTPTSDFGVDFTKKNYEDMYWGEGKSVPEIAKKLKIPYTTLQQDFTRFRIKTRTKKQAMKVWWKRRKNKFIMEKKDETTN